MIRIPLSNTANDNVSISIQHHHEPKLDLAIRRGSFTTQLIPSMILAANGLPILNLNLIILPTRMVAVTEALNWARS